MHDGYSNFDIRFVAIYLRKSRAESLDDLDKHLLILTELCKKSGYKYVVYKEVGTSDSLVMRPEMSKLLKDVESGIYDAVCVVDYDRLSRGDMGDQDRIVTTFSVSNTFIITPQKIYNLNNDSDDEIIDYKAFLARREYSSIKKRLRQGKKFGAKLGNWTNGTPPFPYRYQHYKEDYNAKGLVVDTERLVLYRIIIEQALNGDTPAEIAYDMNKKGLLTVRGNYWSATTIGRLIADETHLGKIISNKTEGDGHKVRRPKAKKIKNFPKSEWIIVENCHKAVKTQEEHDQIIAFLEKRKSGAGRGASKTHAFSGLIKCAKCGGSVTFQKRYKEKKKSVMLKCCHYKNEFGVKCQNYGVNVKIIEEMVFREIESYKDEILNSPINLDKENIYEREIKEKEEILKKTKTALHRINEAFEFGDYSRNEWLDRKRKRENEVDRLESEIYRIKKRIKDVEKTTNEDRLSNIEAFFSSFSSCASNKERNLLYKTIINSIVYLRVEDNININIIFK